MTPDEQRLALESYAGMRIDMLNKAGMVTGAKPEHFGYYGERQIGGCATFHQALLACGDAQMVMVCGAMHAYWLRFTEDNKHTRFIHRLHAQLMEEQKLSRPDAWLYALSYHERIMAVHPDMDLDTFKIVIVNTDDIPPNNAPLH